MQDPSFWEWVWRMASGVAVLIGGLLLYVLRGKDETLNDHSSRIIDLETNHVTRDEFDNAMIALRREFRDEQRAIVDEFRRGLFELRATIDANGAKVTERIDKFMALMLQRQDPPE